MKDAIDDLRQATEKNTAAMAAMSPAVLANAGATATASQAMASAGPAGAAGATGILGMSTATLALVGSIVAVLAVLAPLLLLIAGAIVIMAAFVVGVTAVATSLAIAGALLFGFAAAVVMLADRLYTTGKIMSDPLLGLEANLGKMADTWGRQALPMATQIITWLNSLIPLIQQAGTTLLTWFGGHLPEILSIAQNAFADLQIAAKQLWAGIQPLIDQMIASTPQWENFFNTLLGLGVQAVVGLLSNLLALSNWFLQRWPQMKPIVEEILGKIGEFVQGSMKKLGELVDWFIQHWPQIEDMVKRFFKDFKEGWDQTKPGIDAMITLLKDLQPLLEFMGQHGQQIDNIYRALGFTLGLVVVVLGLVGAAIFVVVTFLTWLSDQLDKTKGFFLEVAIAGYEGFTRIANAVHPLTDALGFLLGIAEKVLGVFVHLAGMTLPLPPSAPAIGGSAPSGNLGSYQSGGVVPGPAGSAQLAIVHGGETVIPTGGGGTTMDDTNEILAAIYQVLSARLQPISFNNAAYGRA